jgi:hypothetical protein
VLARLRSPAWYFGSGLLHSRRTPDEYRREGLQVHVQYHAWMPGPRVRDGIFRAEWRVPIGDAARFVGVAESSHQWMGIIVGTA